MNRHQLGTLNGGVVNISNSIRTNVASRISDYSERLELLMVNNIANQLPAQNIDISRWFISKDITLADPEFGISRSIDLLLGLKTFWNILGFKKMQINNNLPHLIDSKFKFLLQSIQSAQGRESHDS